MSKSFVRSIKNVANGYSSVQVLVRNATSNDSTGPTTYDMEEISALTYSSQTDFLEIMDMLDRRLNDKGKNWRHVAKSLTVLDYLVRFGSEKCVMWARDNLYIVKTLREFIHFDETENDQGALIRVKAKELVSLLRDDERLKHERELAAKSQDPSRAGNKRERRNRTNTNSSRGGRDEPYDDELQQALELSRLTAEEEQRRLQQAQAAADPDLEAALKLSMEEEEMRKQKRLQNENLLDLSDEPPQQQYYMVTGFQQQQQPQQQFYTGNPYQQYDMFGNPIQNPIQTGYYQQQQPQFFQQQTQPQFTGFNYQPQQQQQPQEALQPLKTGSNNPFALQSEQPQQSSQPAQPSLSALAEEQQRPQFFTQPQQQQASPIKQQNTSSSKFNDSTHSELNNLLAQGTGIDTFGNTGASRIPHQHTRTTQFISSAGTGIKPSYGDVRLTTNATGNPFLNTGIGYQGTQSQAQAGSSNAHSQINPAYTGYGFGNAPQQQGQQRNGETGPSLIDI
ncbi:epsin-1 [[Candida] railenensis]|uniref:Epsin-1 n=1 Tax=[Candida] railenensis TaxID=45579 RepID=A0A9P0QWA7_9ASCO|nr:epsin-1 [[Candida] railenensis]